MGVHTRVFTTGDFGLSDKNVGMCSKIWLSGRIIYLLIHKMKLPVQTTKLVDKTNVVSAMTIIGCYAVIIFNQEACNATNADSTTFCIYGRSIGRIILPSTFDFLRRRTEW